MDFKSLSAKKDMMDRIKSASAKERMVMLFRMIEKFGDDATDVIHSVEVTPYEDYRSENILIPSSVVRETINTLFGHNKIWAIKQLRLWYNNNNSDDKVMGLKKAKYIVDHWEIEYEELWKIQQKISNPKPLVEVEPVMFNGEQVGTNETEIDPNEMADDFML